MMVRVELTKNDEKHRNHARKYDMCGYTYVVYVHVCVCVFGMDLDDVLSVHLS